MILWASFNDTQEHANDAVNFFSSTTSIHLLHLASALQIVSPYTCVRYVQAKDLNTSCFEFVYFSNATLRVRQTRTEHSTAAR
jgi:hypothetical protein